MRDNNWPRLLNAYLIKVRDNKFQYGKHDCCTFAAGAVEAMTGENPMASYSSYTSEEEYTTMLATEGKGDLYKTLRDIFGKPTHGAMGQRGDIAFHDGRCGICIGRTGLFLYEEGFGMIPMTQVKKVFRVT